MKDPANWTEADLRRLVDEGEPEGLQLEFKSARLFDDLERAKRELSIAASAFANSAGGTLLVGVDEQNQRANELAGLDHPRFSTDWFDSVIDAKVRPQVAGWRVIRIPLAAGGAAYAISVPAATGRAPHQASDNRYYYRSNSRSLPMEHYQIEDLRRRSSVPDLHASVKLGATSQIAENGNLAFLRATMTVDLRNESSEPALYSYVRLFAPWGMIYGEPDVNWIKSVDENVAGRGVWTRPFITPQTMPIFKGGVFSAGAHEIKMVPGSDAVEFGLHVLSPGFERTYRGAIFVAPVYQLRVQFEEMEPAPPR